jgi:hypothetical protein
MNCKTNYIICRLVIAVMITVGGFVTIPLLLSSNMNTNSLIMAWTIFGSILTALSCIYLLTLLLSYLHDKPKIDPNTDGVHPGHPTQHQLGPINEFVDELL